jgi:hypothetical protein
MCFILFDLIALQEDSLLRVQIKLPFVMHFFPPPTTFPLLGPCILPRSVLSNTLPCSSVITETKCKTDDDLVLCALIFIVTITRNMLSVLHEV